MSYIFLLISLFLFLIPIFLALDQKVFALANLKSLIVPSIIVTVIYSEIGVFLTSLKVWMFTPQYLIGISYRNFPLEAYLFVLFFSFASLGIYKYLNAKFPNNNLQKYSLTISNLMLGIFIAFMFFAYDKWYTCLTFALLLIMLGYIEYVNQLRFMYKFYRAFVACLIPFYICYGIICNLPIIQYDAKETIHATLFNIPFENHIYMMGSLLLGVFTLEYFKSRTLK